MRYTAEELAAARAELEKRIRLRGAPAWRPEPGETLYGELLAVETRTISDGQGRGGKKPCECLLVANLETGEVLACYAMHTLLAEQVREQDPRPGDLLMIRYGGKVTGKAAGPDGTPATYHDWQLAVVPTGEQGLPAGEDADPFAEQ